MALHQSPKIVTDALVFYYDALNEKKSYLGKPTTNFITNGDFAGGLNAGTGGTGGDNPLNEIVRFVNPGDSEYCLRSTAVGGNIYTEYQMDLTTQLAASTTYVMSCWYYFSPDWNGSTAVFHSRAFSSSGANIATGADAGTAIETKVINGATWTRAYQTITTPSDYSNSFNWYLGYPSNNTAGYRYFTNIQMEQGTYPTPFVKGARTTTTAIRDLISNNSITASNLVYANDRKTTFSFNGANSVINIGPSTRYLPLESHTLEAWVKSPGLGAGMSTSGVFGITYGLIVQIQSGGQLGYYAYTTDSGSSVQLFSVNSTGVNLFDNTWHHITCTRTSTTASIYIDGVLNATASGGGAWTGTNTWSAMDAYIGYNPNNIYYWANGYIDSAKIYKKALSASEVYQNFAAQRIRYGR